MSSKNRMNHGKKYLLILLVLCSLSAFAGGLSAWQEETPYGHKIDHDGTAGGWVCLSMDTTSVCFQQFYFYKGHTVAHSDSLYYIIDEEKETLQTFKNKDQWIRAIEKQNLDPAWKREYNANYSSIFGDGILFFIVFFPVPLILPIFWLSCLISLAFPFKWAKGFRKHFSWIYPGLIFLMIIYSIFPQSI